METWTNNVLRRCRLAKFTLCRVAATAADGEDDDCVERRTEKTTYSLLCILLLTEGVHTQNRRQHAQHSYLLQLQMFIFLLLFVRSDELVRVSTLVCAVNGEPDQPDYMPQNVYALYAHSACMECGAKSF